jgi:undecaprenyl diphosphate synthase
MSHMSLSSTQAEIAQIIQDCRLQHVAIIMDGNRRWAKKRFMPTLVGHKQGVDALRTLVRYASDVGLKALTVYAFSTENWQRSDEEVGYLMKLFLEVLAGELEALHQNNVRIRFIGDLAPLPTSLIQLIQNAHDKTAQNTGIHFQIATNYGGRQEITQAVQQLAKQVQSGALEPGEITEDLITQNLYTGDLPDLDMLIRTGGDARISNYLLWQAAYAELYFTDALWPDFSPKAFDEAVREFANRERRYGV